MKQATITTVDAVAAVLACEIEAGVFEQHVMPVLEVARKIAAEQAQQLLLTTLNDDLPDAVIEATAAAIGDAYDCVRVWEAWGVGTMRSDDFLPVADDGDRVAEIARAAISAWYSSISQLPVVAAQQEETPSC